MANLLEQAKALKEAQAKELLAQQQAKQASSTQEETKVVDPADPTKDITQTQEKQPDPTPAIAPVIDPNKAPSDGIKAAMDQINSEAMAKQAADVATKTTGKLTTSTTAQAAASMQPMAPSPVKPIRPSADHTLFKALKPKLNFFFAGKQHSFVHGFFMTDVKELADYVKENFHSALDHSSTEEGPLPTPPAPADPAK